MDKHTYTYVKKLFNKYNGASNMQKEQRVISKKIPFNNIIIICPVKLHMLCP